MKGDSRVERIADVRVGFHWFGIVSQNLEAGEKNEWCGVAWQTITRV